MSGFGEGPGADDAPRPPIVVSATMGTDLSIPDAEREAYLQAHARQTLDRYRAAADNLVKWLLIDGMEHGIQIEDIEALGAIENTPKGRSPVFMRRVMIEMMVSLRRG